MSFGCWWQKFPYAQRHGSDQRIDSYDQSSQCPAVLTLLSAAQIGQGIASAVTSTVGAAEAAKCSVATTLGAAQTLGDLSGCPGKHYPSNILNRNTSESQSQHKVKHIQQGVALVM